MTRSEFTAAYREARKVARLMSRFNFSATTFSLAQHFDEKTLGAAFASNAKDRLASPIYRFRDLRKYRINGPRAALP